MVRLKKFSIIIPVYNGEAFIEPCLNYLSEQNYPNIEIIFVVDQKTTDKTLDMIECYKANFDVKVCIQTDKGRLGFARNLGLKESTGEIIWFLDVDDRPFPTFLEDMSRILEENSADVVACNFYRTDSRDLPDFSNLTFTVQKLTRDEALIARAEERFPVTAWAKVYDRNFLLKTGIEYISGLSEDVDYTYRVLSKADVVCYYNKPLYLYYQNTGSICNSNQNNERGKREVAIYEELGIFFDENYPEFAETFRKKTTLTRMRSMIHMDYSTFKEIYKEGNVPKDAKKYYSDPLILEALLFRACPYLYYHMAKFVMNKIYYKNNVMYDGSMDEGMGDKLFSKFFRPN